jgi:hypothetical protein
MYQLPLDPLTWDSAVAVGLFAVAVLGAAARWWYQKTEPGRTYAIFFHKHPQLATAVDDNEPRNNSGEVYADAEGIIDLPVCVSSKKGMLPDSCSFRLVERQLRPRFGQLWQWKCADPCVASVAGLWDASREALKKLRRYVIMPGGSSVEDPGGGGYSMVYPQPWQTYAGNPRWVRVAIRISERWNGYLEFEAPTPDGRLARTHRSVRLRPSTQHMEGS